MVFDYKLIKPDNEIDLLLCKNYQNLHDNFIEISDDKVIMPLNFLKLCDRIEFMDVKDTDIFVCSYPKAGTTWMQELVWMIMNDLDFERGKIFIEKRFPFIESTGLFKEPKERLIPNSFNVVKTMSDPRFIKTHLIWNLLPDQIKTFQKRTKIIYITRNPKDVCVSFYHHMVLFERYTGSFEEHCKLFLNDRVIFGPFWKHVLSFWEMKKEENVLFLTFEQMKIDLPGTIRQVSKFLGKTLTEKQIDILKNHLSFETMKNNPAVNFENKIQEIKKKNISEIKGRFIRSGTVGGYKTYVTPGLEYLFDKWTCENLKYSDFPYYRN